MAEALEAVFLDHDSREAIEMLWRALRASPVGAFVSAPASAPRVQELLQKLQRARGEEAQAILRSLYLHAPDDPSVREAIRQLAV